ncbi:MAG: polymerase [Pseudomonadota bacterium]
MVEPNTPYRPPSGPLAYAELCALSHFSFQRGASSPAELVHRAHALGYSALAITDSCSMAGVVRAHLAAQACGLHLLIGTELRVAAPELRCGGFTLVLLALNRQGYGQLCEHITHWRGANRRPPTQGLEGLPCHLAWADWPTHPPALSGVQALLLPWRVLPPPLHSGTPDTDLDTLLAWLQVAFPGRAALGAVCHGRAGDAFWLERLQAAADRAGVPLAATGHVHMHVRSRKPLQDVMTALRLGRPVAACGHALHPNAEAHLRPRLRLARLYPEATLAATTALAQRCTFNLGELRYEYPQEVVPPGLTAQAYLAQCVDRGARERYPQGLPPNVAQRLQQELELIAELGYASYFLTVFDTVRHAREKGILCQGRGSAANSVVCYCLGITAVDPTRSVLLFERFISRERREPPDIDVDFEHERREEVIQHLYQRYGRDRAALAAALITYHPRSAVRDAGKALGLDTNTLNRLAQQQHRWGPGLAGPDSLTAAGLDPDAPTTQRLMALAQQLIGTPRHLSQHSGGFVLTGDRLTRTVPVVPAAMPGRTTIEWDKDDIDALGLLKVDILALGMLTALRRTLDLVAAWRGRPMALHQIPAEDPLTYDMVCKADTVGVFQIESRAQMAMLPRLQPRCFYDLVVEVAIVRPGPIQGGMVHPYLQARARQRAGLPVVLPNPNLEAALGRTLGVPIFQEQVMQIAVIAAGFTPGEADALRRAMAAWRRKGGVEVFRQRLVDGMLARGYERAFAEALFRQIEGFGEYGFPESHAASFALLVYASAWLKCHEPACFLVGLLNAQPMGFYSPSQLVQDAQRHGVEVRPVDVCHSDWDCTTEPPSPSAGQPTGQPAVRLGLRLVAQLGPATANRIAQARRSRPFADLHDLQTRAGLDQADLDALAHADALAALLGHRRQQLWAALPPALGTDLLQAAPVIEAALHLPAPGEGEEVWRDHARLGLTLRRHPLALLRPILRADRLQTTAELQQQPHGRLVRACGLVTTRQQPPTAKGVVFLSLEDETGTLQVLVWPQVRARFEQVLRTAKLLAVYGRWQVLDGVQHLIGLHLVDRTPCLGDLVVRSRDFH